MFSWIYYFKICTNFPLLIQALEFLPFGGKVNLKKPEHVFWILEDYGMDPNNIPEDPLHLYFGRWVSNKSTH